MLVQPVFERLLPFFLLVLHERDILAEVYAQTHEKKREGRNARYTKQLDDLQHQYLIIQQFHFNPKQQPRIARNVIR